MYENVKAQSATASLALAATAKTKFDEFLRQQLGISDASNPETVVSALRKLYPSTAARLDDESQGMAIRQSSQPEAPSVVSVGGAESPVLRQFQAVQQALTADLETVMGLAANRPYKTQLGGWRDAVLAELMEGLEATQRAIDPVARDRTFYSVRKLEDYARVARLVALLNPGVSDEFRRLASTQEEAAVVLRVLAGEALFRAGFEEGGSVFQVPFEDVRQRREALLAAVQRFTSGTSDGSDPWADGEASYGKLLERLSEQGHQDLRAIIRPNAMARLLQVLLDKLSWQQPSALRGLASAAPIELMQLRRLQGVASGLWNGTKGPALEAEAASAPLAALVRSLDLFIKAFERPGAGARLLSLVLPSPLASLQLVDAEDGIGTVHTLFRERAYIKAALDAVYAEPGFDPMHSELPVKAERALYDINRVIDLYLLDSGQGAEGQGEQRVQLYRWVLAQWFSGSTPYQGAPTGSAYTRSAGLESELELHLQNVVKALKAPSSVKKAFQQVEPVPSAEVLVPFLRELIAGEREAIQLAVTLTQDGRSSGRRPLLDTALEAFIALHPDTTKPVAPITLPSDPRIPLVDIAKSGRAIARTVVGTEDELKQLTQSLGKVTEGLAQISQNEELGQITGKLGDILQNLGEIEAGLLDISQHMRGGAGAVQSADQAERVTPAGTRQPHRKPSSKPRGAKRADSGKPPRPHSPEHPPHKIQ
jgi:hypothetical protein